MKRKIPYEVEVLAEKLWNYLNFRTPLRSAETILVLCGHDIRIAEYAAELYSKRIAPLMCFSGGLNAFTSRIYATSEAEAFKQRAIVCGVPQNAVLMETQATNTYENLKFSFQMFQELGYRPKNIILVQKPNMLRRAYATATYLYPDTIFQTTSHEISFADAIHEKLTREQLVHELVGDLQRIIEYPKRNWMMDQSIPQEIMQAYLQLRDLGFSENLIPGSFEKSPEQFI